MKWDMLSRICDVVWNDGWSLKYGLCIYMRNISFNVNWQLCDRKMKWSMYINVMLCMNWHELWYDVNWVYEWCKLMICDLSMIWIWKCVVYVPRSEIRTLTCEFVLKCEICDEIVKCKLIFEWWLIWDLCVRNSPRWWGKCVIVRLSLVDSLHWCEIWNWAWRIIPVLVTWKILKIWDG